MMSKDRPWHKGYMYPDREEYPIWEFIVVAKPIVDKNERVEVLANMIIWRNSGNTELRFDRSYTLEPGESLVMGSMESQHLMHLGFDIDFVSGSQPDGEVANNRLERLEYKLKHPIFEKW